MMTYAPNPTRTPQDRAAGVVRNIAMFSGYFFAVTAGYQAVTRGFHGMQSLSFFGFLFILWVIIIALSHLILRPMLEKRFAASRTQAGDGT